MKENLVNRFHQYVLVVAVVSAFSACKQQKAQTTGGPPPVPVSVARAAVETVPFELRVVGSVEAFSTVEVKSQISGLLERAAFTEGQNVEAGALLFEIDSRPYQEALRQAEAAVARDRAQLRQSEANLARDNAQLRNAEAEAARYAELSKQGIISRSQYEQFRTNAEVFRESVRASQAAIESQRAALQSDLAAVDRAKLDISYCRIEAPISGRTGNLLVHPGNLVRANDTPLVVIHRIRPVFVVFSVPEQHLNAIRRTQAARRMPVSVSFQDAPAQTRSGYVSLIDNAVDTTTGTIRLKARLENADGLLWPGQFVNVALTMETVHNAVVVPAEAIQSGQQGQFVYVAKPDGTVEPRVVRPGRTIGRRTIVEQGLAAGDTVVTDGHLRLFPGARIRIVDTSKMEQQPL
jgi:multidrug efflux system membrane fusion protein